MDDMSNKAIMIGVGLLVTIIITSSIITIIGQIKTIYAQVYTTDISIQNSFDEFDMYNNTEKTGIDLLNVSKKYRNDKSVTVKYGSNIANTDSGIQTIENNFKNIASTMKYETKYLTTIELTNGSVVINFN